MNECVWSDAIKTEVLQLKLLQATMCASVLEHDLYIVFMFVA